MTKTKKTRYSVALLIESSNAYARGILEGVIDYQRKHDAWSVFLPEQERGATPPSWLKRWKGDGIIARIETETIAKAVRSMSVPTIDVSAARRLEGIPWIETDDAMVAQLAVEHLVERGFRKLAYCGTRPSIGRDGAVKHFPRSSWLAASSTSSTLPMIDTRLDILGRANSGGFRSGSPACPNRSG